ncbi:hypothetical protein EUGRSUZ_L02601 [Eucalyptus grandis]|uniref:Alcohol dehydrogenase-like C-terminal domain-containing protein n=1 Tax=Eucalyptus grandis TaxID=71139 RepID=A0AAD9T9H3_EUCGR|nr:hypothetical protein EUGRSUZ_L02601 [Eucalyptus grandis]
MEVTNKYVTLKTHVEGAPKESDFELKTSLLALSLNPGSGEMIMKNLYVSIDPYQLNRMKRYCSSQRTGYSGLTAYAGFFEICKPKRGKKVLVSAASGSVGNLVGQYKLGFDEAFNYREETNLNSTLKRYFPDGIDIYFDNVGGEMQEAAVANMNTFGRVAVCGVISEYIDSEKKAAPDVLDVIYKRMKIQGFLAGDQVGLFQDFVSTTSNHPHSGELCPLEDISDGLDSIPFAFTGLFWGDNIGKKIVKIAKE